VYRRSIVLLQPQEKNEREVSESSANLKPTSYNSSAIITTPAASKHPHDALVLDAGLGSSTAAVAFHIGQDWLHPIVCSATTAFPEVLWKYTMSLSVEL
jgi:hypothetical protein